MEKKSGYLDLKGRRAGTAPVLSEKLAILVCDKTTFCYTIPFYFNVLATTASPSPLSPSSILDAILFT